MGASDKTVEFIIESQSCNYKQKPKDTCGMSSFTVEGKPSYEFGGNVTVDGVDGEQKSWSGIGLAVMDKKCNLNSARYYDGTNATSYEQLPRDIKKMPPGYIALIGTVGEPIAKWTKDFDCVFASVGLAIKEQDLKKNDAIAAV